MSATRQTPAQAARARILTTDALAEIRAQVADWPPLSTEQLSLVSRAFASPLAGVSDDERIAA